MDPAHVWMPYGPLLTALAIGLLIGLERGWSARGEGKGRRIAGLRTFGLIGLLGGVGGLLAAKGQPWLLPAMGIGLAALLAIGYRTDAVRDGNVSATTVVAALLTFVLGSSATLGLVQVAAAVAVVAATLLLLREDLHALMRALDDREIRAVLRFLLVAVVVVPLLPNRDLGPYGAINPFNIGVAVVVLSGLSFAGYWATRIWGATRGLLVTAACGGLVSSTAITYTFARYARAHPAGAMPLAAGVVLASLVMLARVLLLSAVLAPALLIWLAPPLLAAGCAGLGAVFWLARKGQSDGPERTVANPFDLLPAVLFALILAAVLLATRWATDAVGEAGLFAVTAVTATMDVDAVILSVSRLSHGVLPPHVAAAALLLAVLINSLIKPALVGVLGNRAMLFAVAVSTLAMALAGALAHLLWR